MNKKFLALILYLPLVAMLGWTAWLYAQKTNGKEVKVAISGYDPRDLLSGHYIQYTIDWEKTDCSQFAGKVCPKDEFCKQAKWGRQCRFYIPEANAKQLDTLFLQRNSTDMVFEVVYSYNKGSEPLAKQLLINGRDWHYSINP